MHACINCIYVYVYVYVYGDVACNATNTHLPVYMYVCNVT